MFETLKTIIEDNWKWRKQINRLAVFELIKKSRGAVLGWAWLFIKPSVYIFVFWFALEVGLRGGGGANAYPPYFLWLISGIIPWFYMEEMMSGGGDVLNRYSYLVTKIKFPQSGISTLFNISSMFVQAGLIVGVFIIYFLYGMPLDIYLLQVPIMMVMMFIYWDVFSVMASQLSALSKDFANLLQALTQAVFWMSGVIFNPRTISFPVIRHILYFDPITFFVMGFRDAFFDKVWFWENPTRLIIFIAIFLVHVILMVVVYRRFHEEVADVL